MYLKALCLVFAASAALADERFDRHMGRELFERNWVQAPSTTRASDGLGPRFNARACATCHPGGGAIEIEEREGALSSVGLVARFETGEDRGDPIYGRQLQSAAISTLGSEGAASLIDNAPSVVLNMGDLAPETSIALRRAPTLAGRGLIAQVLDQAIIDLADETDHDGDGISGRLRLHGVHIGRFGWKAAHVTLADQVAAAFSADMGLSSARFPDHWGDCTQAQKACRTRHDGSDDLGDGFELSDKVISLVTAYVSGLGRERSGSADGLELFRSTGCAACHRPAMATGDRTVAIFSDLLLHDMGEGLAGGLSTPDVDAREWRTAPLIGLVTSKSRILHDGRAKTVGEAIEWHGGEAANSRNVFQRLAPDQKRILVTFVQGL